MDMNERAEALAIAARSIGQDIPRGADNAPCHVGICTREQCQRCRRADFFHAALDRYNEGKRMKPLQIFSKLREGTGDTI